MPGITIAIYGESGSGKSTQAGEYAKFIRQKRGKNTRLNISDRGGFESIRPLVRAGIIQVNELEPSDDPWIWTNNAATGAGLPEDTGLVVFDSGTSMSEALLSACSHAEFQIGQQRTQKFAVTRGKETLNVAINNEAHYGVVQQFMLDAIWKSTWLTRKGIDVLWTFSVHRGEEQDRTPILGPKLAGKALTAAIPKWFTYTFRIASVPGNGDEAPKHVLYTAEHAELAGLGHSFGNSRLPLGVDPIPAVVEPASLAGVFEMIAEKQKEADEALRLELGL